MFINCRKYRILPESFLKIRIFLKTTKTIDIKEKETRRKKNHQVALIYINQPKFHKITLILDKTVLCHFFPFDFICNKTVFFREHIEAVH